MLLCYSSHIRLKVQIQGKGKLRACLPTVAPQRKLKAVY